MQTTTADSESKAPIHYFWNHKADISKVENSNAMAIEERLSCVSVSQWH